MGKNAFKWLITAMATVAFTTSGWAQRVDPGEIEFLSSCAPCHGAEGKGNGPMGAALKAIPPDLTVLAKNNGGVFPFSNVYEVIDGRKAVAAHGTREMPAWGRVRSCDRLDQGQKPKDPDGHSPLRGKWGLMSAFGGKADVGSASQNVPE
jgi:mono/diheme cytochrome c family protein